MSRRAQRRKAQRSARAGKARGRGAGGMGKWLIRAAVILAFGVIVAGFVFYSWLKSYLHSDDFRIFMGETVGYVMDADAEFELFEWQGMHARTAGFKAENGGIIRRMKADGLQADISLAGVRRGVWEISDVRAKQLQVVIDTTVADDGSPSDEKPETAPEPTVDEETEPGFFDSLLPDRAELSSVQIASLNLDLKTAGGDLQASDVAMRVDVDQSSETYDVNLSGGTVDTSWFGSPLDLQHAKGKFRKGHLFLNESRSAVYERGLLTLKGEVDGDRFAFFGVLNDVRAGEMVPEDWQKRITGDLQTRFKVRSDGYKTTTRGELELKRGVLTALPVLDRIAAYANTRRFRRLILSEAKLNYYKEGERLELTEIILASEGLVRVVGDLTVTGGRLDGRFRVGIMPGTLAHIPGAETKVFIRGEKGLLWAPLRITGTVESPQEDLSNRMIAAAGERMFELVPETGKMALKFAHDTATDLPDKVIDAGADVIGEGGVIGEGTGILRKGVGGMLDLIPGSSGGDDE
ncbi:MAG: hypothetical protein KJO79_10425 [Verrucomicrobiae bacterium]|nr:hypothetical protein [Verrucomicrobiae bacterium]NNJ87586.1 hypothetical protein [Akkermansiaceae bacterium]